MDDGDSQQPIADEVALDSTVEPCTGKKINNLKKTLSSGLQPFRINDSDVTVMIPI